MSLNLNLPEKGILRPKITVFGVGGAGGNAVNNMISSQLEGVEFVVANTDAQALDHALADKKIQLGEQTTKGLGAGATPEVGTQSAEEAIEDIKKHLEDANMCFITAGMGGGTGTGAAPVVAKTARDMGILTIGVVTKPFHFEGARRMRMAESGLAELQQHVDTLIVIPNQNLFRIANETTTFADAFRMADDVLHAGIRSVTDLMMMPGLINLDFADVRAVMLEMGKAMMGTGEAEGENRAIEAAEAAISNPLLDNTSMRGARGVLISITGGSDLTLFEVDEAANRIREEVDPEANIIFGSTFNENLEGTIRVSVVATGIDAIATELPHSFASVASKEPAKAEEITAPAQQETAPVPQEESEQQEQQPVASQAEETPSIKSDDAFAKLKEELAQTLNQEQASESYQSSIDKLNEEFAASQQEPQTEQSAEESGERIFVAAAAIEPEEFDNESVGASSNRAATFAQTDETDEDDNADNDEPEQRERSSGFFSRMAKVARSFQSDKKDKKAGEEPELEMAEQSAASSQRKDAPLQDDLLDIPAFLRRK